MRNILEKFKSLPKHYYKVAFGIASLSLVFIFVYIYLGTPGLDILPQTGGNEIVVCPDSQTAPKGCDYYGGDRLQAAVDAAPEGATIIIKAGTYTRQNFTEFNPNPNTPRKAFVVFSGNKKLTVRGEGNVIIDGANSTHDLDGIVATDNAEVSIDNITISSMRESLGGEPIKGDGYGFRSLSNSKMSITNSIAKNNQHSGFKSANNSKLTVSNSYSSSNSADGFSSINSSTMTVSNSSASNNKKVGFSSYGEATTIVSNSSASNNKSSGFVSFNESTMTVSNSSSNNNGLNGFESQYSSTITVSNSSASNNKNGFVSIESSTMTISNSSSNNNGENGFQAQNNSTMTISNSSSNNNGAHGFVSIMEASINISNSISNNNGFWGFWFAGRTRGGNISKSIAYKNNSGGFGATERGKFGEFSNNIAYANEKHNILGFSDWPPPGNHIIPLIPITGQVKCSDAPAHPSNPHMLSVYIPLIDATIPVFTDDNGNYTALVTLGNDSRTAIRYNKSLFIPPISRNYNVNLERANGTLCTAGNGNQSYENCNFNDASPTTNFDFTFTGCAIPKTCNDKCTSDSQCSALKSDLRCMNNFNFGNATNWAMPNLSISWGIPIPAHSKMTSLSYITIDGNIRQHLVANGEIYTRLNTNNAWGNWTTVTSNLNGVGSGTITSFNAHNIKGDIERYATRGGRVWFKATTNGTWVDVTNDRSHVPNIGSGEITGYSKERLDGSRVTRYFIKGGKLYASHNDGPWFDTSASIPSTGTNSVPGTRVFFANYLGVDKSITQVIVTRDSNGNGLVYERKAGFEARRCRPITNPSSCTAVITPVPTNGLTPPPITIGPNAIAGSVQRMISTAWQPVKDVNIRLISTDTIIQEQKSNDSGLYAFNNLSIEEKHLVDACHKINNIWYYGQENNITPPANNTIIYLYEDTNNKCEDQFSNLSANLSPQEARFNFIYSGDPNDNIEIQLSTSPNVDADVYLSFARGKGSDTVLVVNNPIEKWDKYKPSVTLYWRVRSSNGNYSNIITSQVGSSVTPTNTSNDDISGNIRYMVDSTIRNQAIGADVKLTSESGIVMYTKSISVNNNSYYGFITRSHSPYGQKYKIESCYMSETGWKYGIIQNISSINKNAHLLLVTDTDNICASFTPTPTITNTVRPTNTIAVTNTVRPTNTTAPVVTNTVRPTNTTAPVVTNTVRPTNTVVVTGTIIPTVPNTITVTNTTAPGVTNTIVPTNTIAPNTIVCGPLDQFGQRGETTPDNKLHIFDFIAFRKVYQSYCSDVFSSNTAAVQAYGPCGGKNIVGGINPNRVAIEDFINLRRNYNTDSCAINLNVSVDNDDNIVDEDLIELPQTGGADSKNYVLLFSSLFSLSGILACGFIYYYVNKKD
jgi:hypothetical protein